MLGLRVIATTGAQHEVEPLGKAGAHHVLVAPDGVFHKAVRELTDGAGAVIEIAGAPTFGSSLHSLVAGGRPDASSSCRVEHGALSKPSRSVTTD